MKSLKNLKMKKVKNLLSSKDEVEKARFSLEQKTAQSFAGFAKSKHKVQEMAHLKLLSPITRDNSFECIFARMFMVPLLSSS